MVKPPPFSTISDDYTVRAQIAQGGNGIVYVAADSAGSVVAIKMLAPTLVASREKRGRFQNEITFCSTERHPGILRVLDAGVTPKDAGGAPFYVMRRFPKTLRGLMDAKRMSGDEAIREFDSILEALGVAHSAGVVHRDLKPENILHDGTRPVIADFGIAHFTADDLLKAVETQKHDRLANFVYCAPEQKAKGQLVDRRADIFAVGLMLNEAITGHVPHGADYPRIAQVLPAFAFLDEVVSKAIQNSPANRFASAEEMRMAMRVKAQEAAEAKNLESLRATVLPAGEWADSIVRSPIKVDRSKSDWDGEHLILQLTQPVNPLWEICFRRMGGSGMILFTEERWQFRGDRAFASCDERYVSAGISQFEGYLSPTAELYARNLEAQSRQEHAKREEELRRTVAEAEAKERARAVIRGGM